MIDSSKIKVLLVDDSGFMRLVVADMINASEDIRVVETAQNGLEAVEKTKQFSPDVVLMDLTMKDYDGMYAIRHIMKDNPTPIVVLSSLGNTQPHVVFEAMEIGACDFINKPEGIVSSRIREVEHNLFNKLRYAAKADLGNLKKKSSGTNNKVHTFDATLYDMIAIGASTGGTSAVEHILTHLPANLPMPIVIAQHIAEGFIQSFSDRLNALVPFTVKVAEVGEALLPNVAYLLPCDANLEVKKKGNRIFFAVSQKEFKEFNHPSVDCLFHSAAIVYGEKAVGILLTGMGRDGAEGMKSIHEQKGYTIAQDQKSSVVFGMPKAAIDLGAVKQTLSIVQIPSFLVSLLG